MFNINETADTKISEEIIGPILNKISESGVASRGDLLSLESIVTNYQAPVGLANSLTSVPSKANAARLQKYLNDIVVINKTYSTYDVYKLLKQHIEEMLPHCESVIFRLERLQEALNTTYIPNKVKNAIQVYDIDRLADLDIAYFINDDSLLKLHPNLPDIRKVINISTANATKLSYAVLPLAKQFFSEPISDTLYKTILYFTGTVGELVDQYITDIIWLRENSEELMVFLNQHTDDYLLYNEHNVTKTDMVKSTKLYNLILEDRFLFK